MGERRFTPGTGSAAARREGARQEGEAAAGTLPGRLDQVNNTIKSKSPSAKVIVLDYPRLFNGTDCNALTFFSFS